MPKENSNSDSNSQKPYINVQSQSGEDQSNPSKIFGGGHAFRAIQPQQNQPPTSFSAYLQSLQQGIGNPLNSHYYQENLIQPHFQSMHHCHQPQHPRNCSTEMIMSLFEIVEKQTNALQKLNKKVEQVVEKNSELKKKIFQLQQEKKTILNHDSFQQKHLFAQKVISPTEFIPKREISQTLIEGESVTSSDLVRILFGKNVYDYRLRLIMAIDSPLFRERNFSLSIQLIDGHGNRVQNSNKIPMSLAIYTCQNPPKFIEKNTAGQKMLKGYVDQSLLSGVCKFQKVQVRQVTSHYRGGWVFFVVMPCMPPLGGVKNDRYIEFTKIQPLVIDKVVVKAKKPKKKIQEKQEKMSQNIRLNNQQNFQKGKQHDSGSQEWQAD